MRRRQHESPFALAAFTIAAGFLIGTSVLIMNKLTHEVIQTTTTNAAYTPQTETLQADNLRFSIQVPQRFQKVIGVAQVTLLVPGGQIAISRTATNFTNLSDYLVDLDAKRRVKITDMTQQQIDGNDAISRIEVYSNLNQQEKVYDIYADGWVYTFSTSDKALFADLDQIAPTFQYLP